MAGFGKTLIYIGIVLVILGLIFSVAGKIPGWGICRVISPFSGSDSHSISR